MRFGVNMLLFGDSMTDRILDNFPRLKDAGFDGVEVPVFDPGSMDADRIRSAAESAGLELSTSGALPPGARFYGADRDAVRAAERYIRESIKVVGALGASIFCGPLYKPVGDTDESIPLDTQREETCAAMRFLAAEARDAGVTLALEPLNRFETNMITTVAQGVQMCRELGPGAGLLLDTFHMHIEEKNSAAAIEAAALSGVFSHFHASENDRGIPGSGQVHWEEIAAAAAGSGYGGWTVLESFCMDVQAIKTAVSCWRPFYPTTDEFIAEGLAFAKELFGNNNR